MSLFTDECGNVKPAPTIGCGMLAIILLVFLVTLSPITIVSAGDRGIVATLGKVQDTPLTPGFHIISPFSDVTHVDVQTQRTEASSSAASKDLQVVSTVIVLNYRLNENALARLYKEVGMDYESKLIAPAIQESVKAATALFTAEELITKRSEVGAKIEENLTAQLAQGYFTLENVSIVNFDFSPQFNEAIERKVTAEQDALASKNKLEQTRYEAEQKVVSATAEAESIRIQAQSVSQQGGADYVKLQWVQKWDGKLPTTMLGDDTSVILP